MSLISVVGRRSWKTRGLIALIYAALIVMGTSMVAPFLITITGSLSDDFDYERFRPVPRFLWSRRDRFVKGLVDYFNGYRNWTSQMRAYIPDMPAHWSNWSLIGRDVRGSDALAAAYLQDPGPGARAQQRIAADYADFMDRYPLDDTRVYAPQTAVTSFLVTRYTSRLREQDPQAFARGSRRRVREAALRLLGDEWGLPFESFYTISFASEMGDPMDFQGWFPPLHEPKYQAYNAFKRAAAEHAFTPGIRARWRRFLRARGVKTPRDRDAFPPGDDRPELLAHWRAFKREVAPATAAIPFAMRAVWIRFLSSDPVALQTGLPSGTRFDIQHYNELAGTTYANLHQTPFPIPASFDDGIQALWQQFLEQRFPLRRVRIDPTPELERHFQDFLQRSLQHLHIANELLGTAHADWDAFALSAVPLPARDDIAVNRREVWKNFVSTLPAAQRAYSSSEMEYQRFLLDRYGRLEEINRAYGWNLRHIEEAFPPFMAAYAQTFRNLGTRRVLASIANNYRVVTGFLLLNSNAVFVTLVLVLMTVAFTLTVNPLAAYALSRFNLRGQDMIMVFMLATMAFPAMVSAIPAYLLMRDMGLLNTFWALVLPGAANGMSIFILKGFFDSLPMELFEAATIDGASEMQIFRIVAMPLVKPILAINALTAFIVAYNGWEWALIICQKPSMWTLAVWMYQASSWWSASPWLISTGFVLTSIPTLIMFVSCQKIILRGIIIPTLK